MEVQGARYAHRQVTVTVPHMWGSSREDSEVPTITDPIVRCSEDVLALVEIAPGYVKAVDDMCLTPLTADGTCPRADIHTDTSVIVVWECSECSVHVTDVTSRTMPDGTVRDLCVRCATMLGLPLSGARRRAR